MISEYIIDSVKIDKFEIKYLKFGHGNKTMVIIPGLSLHNVLLSAPAIVKQYEKASDEYTVYLFGRKDNVSRGYSIDDIADELVECMDILNLKDTYALGLSQGGMILESIITRYKGYIKKVVLGSTMARINNVADETISRWKQLASEYKVENLNLDIFNSIYNEKFLEKNNRALEFIAKQGTKEECDRFCIMADTIKGFDVYEDLNNVQCEVFVIGDEDDKVVTGKASYEIAEKLNCKIYMYSGYGHAVYDTADDYLDRVLGFYKED